MVDRPARKDTVIVDIFSFYEEALRDVSPPSNYITNMLRNCIVME